MPGKIIYTPKPVHECSGQPTDRGIIDGTLWQCDECDQVWKRFSGLWVGNYAPTTSTACADMLLENKQSAGSRGR